MAHYKPPQSRPAGEWLCREFVDQSESDKFSVRAKALVANSGIDEHAFILNCIAHLHGRDGISELTEFMSFVKSSLNIVDDSKSQSKAYEFVKGIPALSNGRIGYTFGKKGGLFFFLRKQGANNDSH